MDCEILIVGAGLSGLGAAIQLKKHGFDDFIIIDRAGDIGGTWRDNTYPGVTVDIPTIYYSFSYEQRSDWSSFYAPQRELFRYCQELADKYDLRRQIEFDREVDHARYDSAQSCWITHLVDGSVRTSRYLISGTGMFSVLRWPDIPGIERFQGPKVHTMRWDHALDFRGKRVGIVGTGATGVQVIPEIAEVAGQLAVFQRTPTWVMPKPDKAISPRLRWALANIPGFQRSMRLLAFALVDIPLFSIIANTRRVRWLQRRLQRMCVDKIATEVSDPGMRVHLTPKFDFGCRRPTFSNKYYPCFNRDNVELITSPISCITDDGIATADGRTHIFDILICATGFQVFQKGTVPTFRVYGEGGHELAEKWGDGPFEIFKGVSVNGFPNYFMVYGPHSFSSLSYIFMIESSVRHIVRVLKKAKRRNATRVEVKAEAQSSDYNRMIARAVNSINTVGSCSGSGASPPGTPSPPMRPDTCLSVWWKVKYFNLSSYTFGRVGKRLHRFSSYLP